MCLGSAWSSPTFARERPPSCFSRLSASPPWPASCAGSESRRESSIAPSARLSSCRPRSNRSGPHRRHLLDGEPHAQHHAYRRDGSSGPSAQPPGGRGPHADVFPRRFARHFDVVFRGEADLSSPRFCRDYFERGASAQTMAELPLDAYCGLFVPNHGLKVDNAATHHDEDELEAFPLPDRSDFDHAAYQEVWFRKTGTKVASIIVTLGCPFAATSARSRSSATSTAVARRRLRRDRAESALSATTA